MWVRGCRRANSSATSSKVTHRIPSPCGAVYLDAVAKQLDLLITQMLPSPADLAAEGSGQRFGSAA